MSRYLLILETKRLQVRFSRRLKNIRRSPSKSIFSSTSNKSNLLFILHFYDLGRKSWQTRAIKSTNTIAGTLSSSKSGSKKNPQTDNLIYKSNKVWNLGSRIFLHLESGGVKGYPVIIVSTISSCLESPSSDVSGPVARVSGFLFGQKRDAKIYFAGRRPAGPVPRFSTRR